MPYGTVNADVIGTSVTNTSLGAGNATRFKNRIINGDMRIDQRNGGAAVTPTTDGTYTLDRWVFRLSQASKWTIQQNGGSVTPPAGYINYLGVTIAASIISGASDYFALEQKIEGLNVADLGWGTANAKPVTLSFLVYTTSIASGTLYGGAIQNSAGDRSYPFTYTISAANTWTQISVTIPGDTTGTWLTTNGIGIQVFFGILVGSTYAGTSGAWAAANYYSATGVNGSGSRYFTGVQLEVGESATGFEYVDYTTQLAMCQRYYWKNLATQTGSLFGVGNTQTTTSGLVLMQNPVMMRATPVVGYSNVRLDDGTTGRSVTSLGTNYSTVFTSGGGFNTTLSLTRVGDCVVLSASNSSGYIDSTAEL
jgi:hypothetical protein